MKTKSKKDSTFGGFIFDFFREWKMRFNQMNGPFARIKTGLGIALVATLTGCVGWVDGGGDYGGAVVVPGPDIYFFGGGYERGRDVRAYSHRGFESHVVAHPSGGRASGGGGHGKKR